MRDGLDRGLPRCLAGLVISLLTIDVSIMAAALVMLTGGHR